MPTRRPRFVLLFIAFTGCQARDTPPPTTAEEWTDQAPHREGTVSVNGASINYLDWGGSGRPLILIHGNIQNAHVFDALVPLLGSDFRVIAYTRRGFGRSSKVGPFDAATFTEDLRALMDSLGIARAHLAGWSLGGNEVTRMAGLYPDRVDRIVYLDAGYDWADPASAAAFQAMPMNLVPSDSALRSVAAYQDWILGLFAPTLVDRSLMAANVRGMVDIQPDGGVRPVTSDSVAAQVATNFMADRRDYTRVKAPALAIYSEVFLDATHGDSVQRAKTLAWEQGLFAPFRVKSIERIKREVPSVEVVFVPGAHPDFVITYRDTVAAAMRRFLQ